MGRTIYLDNGTKTSPSSHVIQQALPFVKRYWHAPHALYLTGKEPIVSINRSIDTIKEFIGAGEKEEFAFATSTKAALESICQEVYLHHIIDSGCNHLLTTAAEPISSRNVLANWEKGGCSVKKIPLNNAGQVTVDNLKQALSKRTGFVSLTWGNEITGVIQPIWELADICHQEGIIVHVDASAVVGKLYFQLRDLPIDFLTFSGRNIHGLDIGTALFACKRDREIMNKDSLPTWREKFRGVESLAHLVGLAVACQEASDLSDHMGMEVARLRDQLEEGLVAECGAKVLFSSAERLPHLSTLTFPGISGEMLAFCLQEKGIYANRGGGYYSSISELLLSLGVEEALANCALSFGLSHLTTEEEIKQAVGTIADQVNQCRLLAEGVL